MSGGKNKEEESIKSGQFQQGHLGHWVESSEIFDELRTSFIMFPTAFINVEVFSFK